MAGKGEQIADVLMKAMAPELAALAQSWSGGTDERTIGSPDAAARDYNYQKPVEQGFSMAPKK